MSRVCSLARSALAVARALPALPYLVGRVAELEHDLDEVEALVRELYVGEDDGYATEPRCQDPPPGGDTYSIRCGSCAACRTARAARRGAGARP